MLPVVYSKAVAEARASGKPVVALETSVLSQGLPQPQNLETALAMEAAVREAGAVPATIALVDGAIHVGLDQSTLETFATGIGIAKAGARDIGPLLATGTPGATTVSATMRCAALAGIRIMATGGIGGVHRGAEESLDISADLQELGRTPVAVICSGAKSILDLPKTLEVLESLSVPVLGYGTDHFPAFHSRASDMSLDWRVDTPEQASAAINFHWQTRQGGILVANPVPDDTAIAPALLKTWVDEALRAAARNGVSGKAVTPYLLSAIAEASAGQTLDANISLLISNGRLAGKIAAAG